MRIAFRTKFIGLMTFGIIIMFLIIGITFSVVQTNELRREIINEATMFVQLTKNELGDAFVRYYKTSLFRFREIVQRQMRLAPDLKSIQIVGLDHVVYYESGEEEKFLIAKKPRLVSDSFILQNMKKMEPKQKIAGDLKIVAPYIDEYGAHKYAIVYTFSLIRLARGIALLHQNTLLLCLGIIIVGVIISALLSTRITNHLINLRNAAQKIALGDFSQMVDIRTNDEFEELARVFNFMASEIRGSMRDLRHMVGELKKRDREKMQFLANLSHELRTPLTASLGYVDYMAKGKLGSLTKDQAHGLAIIRRNLERLTLEISSLLDISKYTLQGIKLTFTKISLQEVIATVLTDFHPDIEMKKIAIDIRYSATADNVKGDRDYLKIVFENLIGNSIKFSPDGERIAIGTADYFEKDKKYVCLKIINRGPQIPKKDLNKIFEPFFQVDSSTKKIYGGIGLGLSIARLIIEAHRGRIWAEIDKDMSIFNVTLPHGG